MCCILPSLSGLLFYSSDKIQEQSRAVQIWRTLFIASITMAADRLIIVVSMAEETGY